ncbi:hypothetical protein AB0383_10990 [Amycolatopsis sp. NPDC051373]|uniref:hypothetical protein n=1 Tax=Amycolatopsis sp. NPDC051373 TaxID=3155801 RepID=UPI00344C808A
MDNQLLNDVAEPAEVHRPHEPGAATFLRTHHERLAHAQTPLERRRTLRSSLGLFRGAAGSFNDLSLHDHTTFCPRTRMEELRAAVARQAGEELDHR